MDSFRENRDDILLAFGVTIEMVVIAGFIALLVGTLLAALRLSLIHI